MLIDGDAMLSVRASGWVPFTHRERAEGIAPGGASPPAAAGTRVATTAETVPGMRREIIMNANISNILLVPK